MIKRLIPYIARFLERRGYIVLKPDLFLVLLVSGNALAQENPDGSFHVSWTPGHPRPYVVAMKGSQIILDPTRPMTNLEKQWWFDRRGTVR